MAEIRRMLDVTIEGDKALFRKLSHLKASVQRRILKRAVTDAIRPWVKESKQRAPKQSRLLSKSLGVKVTVNRHNGVVTGMVGPRKGFKREVTFKDARGQTRTEMRDPIRYAHLAEKHTRFLRLTYEAGREAATQRLNARIASEIEKEAKKV